MTEFDPEALLRALAEHKVDFHVIGAVAAWLQGSPVTTLDLDVMPRRDLDNAEKLAAALNALGARHRGDRTGRELEGADFPVGRRSNSIRRRDRSTWFRKPPPSAASRTSPPSS
jgi:hypothetical protein